MPRCTRSAAGAVLVATLLVGVVAPAVASAAPPPTYRPPVDAEVVDGFRPPTTPYGPGNRGLEYGTAPGTEVRAAASGRVTFAGLVAGSRHVTIRHDDGLRTTSSYLARIDVVVGQQVAQGDVVGTTVGRLHLSARSGDSYLDPATLFEPGPPQVRLVPFDEPPGSGPSGERSAIRQLLGFASGAASSVGGAVGEVAGATAAFIGDKAQLARTVVHYAHRLTLPLRPTRLLWAGAQVVRDAYRAATRACTGSTVVVAPPASRRVAVLVAGLGSDSEHAAIDEVDVGALGYDPGDVLRFSYEGGRTPGTGAAFVDIRATTYDARDSQADLRRSGARLADLIEAVAARSEGAPVDLLAHSQGGVVARLALIELEERHGRAWLERLGLMATLGTPHGGADLATAIHAISETPAGSDLLGAVDALGVLSISSAEPSAEQLSETSGIVDELRAHPVPASVPFVSIAARGDLIVPSGRTEAAGATEVVVPIGGPTAHDRLPGSPEATRELALAVAGAPPACQSLGDALTDQLTGEVIGYGEDLVGAGALALSVACSLKACVG